MDPSYFDDQYAGSDDPWGFTDRWYEQRKYAITMGALPTERYHRVLEVGCSIGVLSQQLAARCDSLLCVDINRRAATLAQHRLRGEPHAEVVVADVATHWPAGSFDLIVVSEVLYYFDPDVLRGVLGNVVNALDPGGHLVVVHWRHPVAEYPATGDAVHTVVGTLGLASVARYVDADFVLDVLCSSDEPTVAQREGLVTQ